MTAASEPPRTPLSAKGGHIAALDGVRGIAILLVLMHHFWGVPYNFTSLALDRWVYRLTGVGWIGVDLFFVLSGFLITGILLEAKTGTHYFVSFYARRFLRIFPVYYLFLFGGILLLPLLPAFRDDRSLTALRDHQFGYWTYLQNVVISRNPLVDLGSRWAGHLWSLAVEEQFYIVWPAVVLILGRRSFIVACLLSIVGAPLIRFALLHGAVPSLHNGFAAYTLMPARMDALAAGALLAVLARERKGLTSYVPLARVLAVCAFVVLATLFVAGHGLAALTDERVQLYGFTATAAGGAAFLIIVLTGSPAARLQRLCTSDVLTFFGRYSYGMYVFHYPIARQLADRVVLRHGGLPTVAGSDIPAHIGFMFIGVSITVVVSWLSWHLYEQQFLRLKKYFPYGRQAARRTTQTPPEIVTPAVEPELSTPVA